MLLLQAAPSLAPRGAAYLLPRRLGRLARLGLGLGLGMLVLVLRLEQEQEQALLQPRLLQLPLVLVVVAHIEGYLVGTATGTGTAPRMQARSARTAWLSVSAVQRVQGPASLLAWQLRRRAQPSSVCRARQSRRRHGSGWAHSLAAQQGKRRRLVGIPLLLLMRRQEGMQATSRRWRAFLRASLRRH